MESIPDIKLAKTDVVYKTLRGDICSGKYAATASFPSERALARRFSCSHLTIDRAVLRLCHEGLLTKRPGSGTFLTLKARRQLGRIGLILPGMACGEFFSHLCRAFTQVAQEAGFSILLGDASNDDPVMRVAQTVALTRDFVKQGVDGVIVQPIERAKDAQRGNEELLGVLKGAHVPFVLIDSDVIPPPKWSGNDLVEIDNAAAGRLVGEHLMERGAKRIAFCDYPDCSNAALARMAGVEDAVLRQGGVWYRRLRLDSKEAVRRVFTKRTRPDAIVCSSDFFAAQVIKRLVACRVRVPDDVMVAGFNDLRLATVVTPALTSIHQPCDDLARSAFALLQEKMAHPFRAPRRVVLASTLTVRESTERRPPASKGVRIGK